MDKYLLEDGSGYYQLEDASGSYLIDRYVELSSPANAATVTDTTPTLEFTGYDPESQDIKYNLQIDITTDFKTLADSYSEANQNTSNFIGASNSDAGQTFTATGGILNSVEFYLRRAANATGTMVAKLYAHTGTFGTNGTRTGAALATSDIVQVSSLTTSFQLIEFTFSGANNVTLTNGTNYVIVAEYLVLLDVEVGIDSTSPTHAGNATIGTGSSSSTDTIFYLYTAPLLNKLSGTDAGFLLTDNFADNSTYVPLWNSFANGSATIAETSGTVVSTPASSVTAGYAGYITDVNRNFTGGSFSLKVPTVPNTATGAQVYLKLVKDGNNSLQILEEAGTIKFQKIVAGVTSTPVSAAYSSTTHLYWRIRETAGTTYWETSTDGVTYTARHSEANPVTVTAIGVEFAAGTYQLEVSPGTAVFDDATFQNVDTYPSGMTTTYTVQSELSGATYYWRVRGIDPAGSNTYSAWSATRSFTVSTGPSLQTITATGKSSTATIGVPTVTPGSVSISPIGINSTVTLGSATVDSVSLISATSVSPTTTLGTPTVTPGAASITAIGRSSTLTIGTTTLTPGSVTISPSSINAASVIGSPTLTSTYTFGVTAINSTSIVGNSALSPGSVTLSPGGISTTNTIGSPVVDSISLGQTINTTAISSTSVLGTPSLNSSYTLTASSISPTTSIVTPTLSSVYALPVGGITSTVVLGNPTLQPGSVSISVTGKNSTLTLGSPTLNPGSVGISATGIASSVSLGVPTLTTITTISPTGLVSISTVGTPTLIPGSVSITITGISNTVAIGSPTLTAGLIIQTTSISGTTVVGTPSLTGDVTILSPSIISTSSTGTVGVMPSYSIVVTSISSTSSISVLSILAEVTILRLPLAITVKQPAPVNISVKRTGTSISPSVGSAINLYVRQPSPVGVTVVKRTSNVIVRQPPPNTLLVKKKTDALLMKIS